MNKENYDFDKIESITQLDNSLVEYGIIRGNNIIVFIKSGLKGTYYGYENQYLKIAKLLNEKNNCTVICASNPNGYKNDFDAEMKFIDKYAQSNNLKNYKIYYFRSWKKDENIYYDVGSHTEYFILTNKNFKNGDLWE